MVLEAKGYFRNRRASCRLWSIARAAHPDKSGGVTSSIWLANIRA